MVNQSINIFSFNTKNISLQIDYLVYYMYFVLILSTRLKEKSTLNFDWRVVSLKYSTNIHTFAFIWSAQFISINIILFLHYWHLDKTPDKQISATALNSNHKNIRFCISQNKSDVQGNANTELYLTVIH